MQLCSKTCKSVSDFAFLSLIESQVPDSMGAHWDWLLISDDGRAAAAEQAGLGS